MRTSDDRPPTTGERYARASVTSDLRLKDHPCDADKLLAAGYAACGRDRDRLLKAGVQDCGNPRKTLALRLYRMRYNGDTEHLSSIVAESDRALAGRLNGTSGRSFGNRLSRQNQRFELVTSTLRWWMNPICGYCEGRGMEVIDGAPALSGEECAACHGTGRTPLARVVPGRLVGHARWLADEWDVLTAIVLGDMAILLRNQLDDALKSV